MPVITEQVILVTGATDGIGRQVAADLAARGATVGLHGRDPDRVATTERFIRDTTGSERLSTYVADLSSLDEIRELSAQVEEHHGRLDVLVNNAGVGSGARGQAPREISRDGFELRLAVNYLAPFLLTNLLVPLLRASAPARVVNVASAAQRRIDFDDVMLDHDYDGRAAYAQSKLALVAFTFSLAERLDPREVTVNCLHPGSLLDTKMVREAYGSARGEVQSGADAVVRAATAAELEGVTGRYFDVQREGRPDEQAHDPQARQELWQLAQQLTGLGDRVA